MSEPDGYAFLELTCRHKPLFRALPC